jgi:small-conductance mechanosensitive channel
MAMDLQNDLLRDLSATLAGYGFVLVSATRIVGIVLIAWLLIVIAQRAIRGVRERISARLDNPESVRRAETIGRAARYMVAVIITALAGMLVLSELGVSVAPILGAAGVVGVAVGFGAQSLVRDYFTGFFLLVEDQIRQGDVVRLGEHAGVVEEVTLRYVMLRDYDGHVHYVPNGTITSVVNMGRGHAQAVIDVGIGYGVDIDAAIRVMRDVASGLRTDPTHGARILDDLEVAGVERWADSAVIVRVRFRVAPLAQWTVRREYLRRLKYAFDAAGIEIPFPQVSLNRGRSTTRPSARPD